MVGARQLTLPPASSVQAGLVGNVRVGDGFPVHAASPSASATAMKQSSEVMPIDACLAAVARVSGAAAGRRGPARRAEQAALRRLQSEPCFAFGTDAFPRRLDDVALLLCPEAGSPPPTKIDVSRLPLLPKRSALRQPTKSTPTPTRGQSDAGVGWVRLSILRGSAVLLIRRRASDSEGGPPRRP
jgi:hypothetical protein